MKTGGSLEERALAFRLFERALELEPPSRPAFLDSECRGNTALRDEVLSLLEDEEQLNGETGEFLAPLGEDPARFLGRVFGRFEAKELIGQGGMGIVFRAERTDGIDQKVALKLLHGGGLTGTRGGRFAREMKTLARLEHPAVARLIDAGVADEGIPWIAMELVSGALPIDTYCDAQKTPLRERVRLLVEIADAVSQAHRLFVVHRDIKPNNVLMTSDGTPKLIDFGIAKLLDDHTAGASLTKDAGALFTPQYASPEQVAGAPASTTTDVFGLGALAFRLLSGTTLFPDARSPLAYMLAVTTRDAPLPSRAARDHGQAGDARLLHGDLDSVLAKALAKETARRYPTVEDFREDLVRYLERRSVKARPPSVLRSLWMFARRNALASILVALLLGASTSSALSFVWQAERVRKERDAAQAASARAERINQFLTSMLQASDPAEGGRRDVTVAQVLDRAASEASHLSSKDPIAAADAFMTIIQTDSSLARFPEAFSAEDRLLDLLRGRPNEDLRLAHALIARADTLWSMSRWSEAEAPARESISLLAKSLPEGKDRAAELGHAQHKLAMILSHDNKEAEAEATYRDAREAYRAAGVVDLRLASLLNDFGVLVGGQGRNAEALAFHEEARDVALRAAPADRPIALTIQMNLAGDLEVVGRREEAVAIYEQVIAARERISGPEHPDTLWVKTSLASVLDDLGRFAEAVEVAAPTAEALERTRGPAHFVTAFAWNVLGIAQCGTGRYDLGIATLKRAERARIALNDTWRAANTRVRIGICLSKAGRHEEAEKVFLPAVKILEESRGPSFERTQDAYRAIRDLYLDWGHKDEAALWDAKVKAQAP